MYNFSPPHPIEHYNDSNTKNIYTIISLFIISFVLIVYPLLNKNELSVGHDLEYHLLRIEALFFEIKHGNFFPKIDYLFFNGRGYASSLFYNDFFLYPGALLRFFGFSPETSYRFIIYILQTITFVTAFFCAKKIFHSSRAGMLCAFLYTICQYRVCCIHTRCALGEIQAISFLPLIVYAVYDFYTFNISKRTFIISFSCVMVSHTITFLFSLIFFLFVSIYMIKHSVCKIKYIIFNFTSIMILTAFYWVPFLEMYICSDLNVKAPWTQAFQNTTEIKNIFYGEKMAGASLGLNFLIFFICIYAYRIYFYKNISRNIYKYFINISDKLFLVSMCIALCTTGYFPWKQLGFLNMIQFPWRIFGFVSLFLSLSVTSFVMFLYYTYNKFYFKSKYLNINIVTFALAIITISTTIIFYYDIDYHYREFDNYYFSNYKNTYTIGVCEWLPRNIDLGVFQEADSKTNHTIDETYKRVCGNKFYFVNTDKQAKYIDIPLIYYKGYRAYYNLNNDIYPLRCDGKGFNGLTRVYLTSQNIESIVVEYHGTLLQKISLYISFMYIVLVLFLRKKYFLKT